MKTRTATAFRRLTHPVISFAVSAVAHATIVFDTTGMTPTGSNFFKGPTGFLPYTELGFVFHVPSTSDYQIDSLTFSFNTTSNTAAPLELAAFTTGTGTPQGLLLSTFSGPTSPVSMLATYTPDTTFTLPADSDVFFRFKVANAGGLYRVDNTNDPLVPTEWSFVQLYIGNSVGDWTANANAPVMQVTATAVPEPGSLALLSSSALFLLRRRR